MIHLHGTQAVAFRVLIVDGEALQRGIIARCVEMLGWTADTAACVDEALGHYSRRPHNTVVVALGPGLQNTEHLLRRLRRDRADPVVIFIAGRGLSHATAAGSVIQGAAAGNVIQGAAAGDVIQGAAAGDVIQGAAAGDVIQGAAAGDLTYAAARLARDLGLRVAGTLGCPVDPYSLHAMLLANPIRKRDDQRRIEGNPSARDLDRALREGEIHTEYQPKTDLTTGEIVGVEALARWHSPVLGLVTPDQFVPVAEQSNLINRLTFKVLTDAVAACRRWREMRPNCSVAVNFSPRVLADPGLLPAIEEILSEQGLPPKALIAEVTELSLLSNLPAAADMLTRLSLKGVLVSIDDFGTGYSSVLSLLRLPFAELKIDGSFVGVCRTDPEAWKLVRATVSMARELEMNVVAEGIETAAISDRLRDAGCDTGQGWFFGRPMQEAAILRWLTPSKLANAEPAKLAGAEPAKLAGAEPVKLADAEPPPGVYAMA